MGVLRSEFRLRSIDCSSGFNPCTNFGSLSAFSRSAAFIPCSVCSFPLTAWRRSGVISCHFGSSSYFTLLRSSGDNRSHFRSRPRRASLCSGVRLFHFCRFWRICCCFPGGRLWKRSLFCIKRSCSAGGLSRRFSTHFGGSPAIPRALVWPLPLAACSFPTAAPGGREFSAVLGPFECCSSGRDPFAL